ncbi:methyl-accepting chemotaxis protein [Ureibacillus xyleni]|uniref:Methyl-accepting chemotaxis protein n=1 Tax=Ureibacillus xyleni TaxID=614648 RepID=A0A285SSS4_9BACL|nr:methyl-accepting chemotaxis protein [Ureibacillus xyleni]SOC11487.1 methyl-accepting chemotaxis protein [Ureibacillus xyleni]
MRFTIRKKLLLGFSSILVLLLIIGILSKSIIKNMNEEYTFLIDDRIHKVTLLKELTTSHLEQSLGIRGYFVYGTEESIEDFDKAQQNVHGYLDELKKIIIIPKVIKLLNQLEEAVLSYDQIAYQSIEAERNGNHEKALEIAVDAKSYSVTINDLANEISTIQYELMDKSREELEATTKAMNLTILVLIIVSILLGGIIAFVIARSVSQPIDLVSKSLKDVSSGDLTIEKITIKNRDEIGSMVQYLNEMVDDLRNLVTKVNNSALDVASQSQELSASSQESSAAAQMMAEIAQDSATGSETQLAVINNVTASISDMSNGVKEISSSSKEMLEATQNASIFVQEGSVTVDTSTKQMNELNLSIAQLSEIIKSLSQQSNEISNITTIINGIADQTNLLALNATIEAARAGEAGKGFAVVADEVRHLAEQSKISAGQINTMIHSIQNGTAEAITAIEKGNEIVQLNLESSNETRNAFNQIKEATTNVSGKVQIVASATEQINSVAQGILQSIEELQVVAKQAADNSNESSAAIEEQVATMEQISASAQSLSALSENLQSLVSTFKI